MPNALWRSIFPMRLKTQLVLAITGMIVALVVVFSYIYVSQLLQQRISAAYETATLLAHELQDAAADDFDRWHR